MLTAGTEKVNEALRTRPWLLSSPQSCALCWMTLSMIADKGAALSPAEGVDMSSTETDLAAGHAQNSTVYCRAHSSSSAATHPR